MLYEMLTGKWPFTGRTRDELMMKHLSEPPPPLTLDRGAAPELEAVIKRALAKERDARPEDAKAFGYELQAAMTVTLTSLLTFEFDTVTLDARGQVTERRKGRARYFLEDLGGGVKLEMVEIPAGTFMMGAPESEVESIYRERPQHEVSVPSFYMGKFEVTQAQWRVVANLPKVERELNPDPSNFKGSNLPVEQVSWEESVEFCQRLSKKTGREYRLPSEAEWEYAARAGTQTPFAFGETITPEIVNYAGKYTYAGAAKGTYRRKTVAVGSLGVANGFGLSDLHGNVFEWCLDHGHKTYSGSPTDGSGWVSGGDSNYRVSRGGAWYNSSSHCRSAYRVVGTAPDFRSDSHGLRVVAVART
jgi:formylglycine-generating enzyme required for sulfatase activity